MWRQIQLAWESFLFAVNSVVVNRLRTLLSLLGITIGIFAIISVFTILDSLENNIRDSLAEAGENVIYVQKWPWGPEEGKEYEWWQYWNRPVPTYREYEAIRDGSKKSEAVCFYVVTGTPVKYKNNSIDQVMIWGSTREFSQTREFELIRGRFFTEYEFTSGRNLALIGYTIAEKLFTNQDPVGKQINIKGRKLTVVGVAAKEGKSLFGGGSLDEVIVLPMNYIRNIVNIRRESMNPMIWVKAKPNVANEELKAEVRQIMRAHRRLKPRADDNFALNQTSMMTSMLDQVFKVINLAGFFIGIFSILVGGFGIANIMFVSVKERTNIIGIQKALGAKRSFILMQFLLESVLLTLSGGIIGLLIVFAGALILSGMMDFFTITLSTGNIILGISISAAIGVISGFAPAWSAAKMDPVEAINTSF